MCKAEEVLQVYEKVKRLVGGWRKRKVVEDSQGGGILLRVLLVNSVGCYGALKMGM